jgi:hypothetical protein
MGWPRFWTLRCYDGQRIARIFLRGNFQIWRGYLGRSFSGHAAPLGNGVFVNKKQPCELLLFGNNIFGM